MMKWVVRALLALGIALMTYRAAAGLGAVTALTDYQPWGLVKAVNIFTFATLAAGSFAVAASVYVFGLVRLRPLVRPALTMGFVGHSFVLVALLYDVGRPLDVWRVITNPQPHSALLWTAWCEVVYTSVMALELLPEYLKTQGGLSRSLSVVKVPLVILSASFAVVYQSTLGTLFLVSPHRVSPLWYSPHLPALFFLSALAAGLGMLIMESYISDRAGRRPAEPAVTRYLAGSMCFVLAVYLVLRLSDLYTRGMFACAGVGCGRVQAVWLGTEIIAGAGIPFLIRPRLLDVGAVVLAVAALEAA